MSNRKVINYTPAKDKSLSRGFGASVGARTRTEGVGGLYGIQFHHGRVYLPYNYIIKYFICKFITGCVIIVFENYF